MQNTPVVSLPKEERGRNLFPLIAALAIIAVVLILAVLVARPDLLVREPEGIYYANPELIAFDHYMESHPEAKFSGEFLRENPEVNAALQWQVEH